MSPRSTKAPHQRDLDTVVSMATGEDGGVCYVNLRNALDAMAKQAADGDSAAAEILAHVARFARLVRLFEHKHK